MPTASNPTAPSSTPSEQDAGPGRPTARRVLIGFVALVVVLYAGIGWYVSGEIIDGMVSSPNQPEYDTDVIAVSTDEVTLDVTDAEDVEADADAVGGVIGDSFLAVGRLFTWLRTGLDFDTVDYIERADALDVPILLFHGRLDEVAPFAIGEALAAARPDLVEFHPIDGGAHVRAWNEDPEAYGRIVEEFLNRIGRS